MALGLAAVLAVACDKVPLTAPASSTITLSTPTRTLPTGGSTQLSAQVVEQAGTPVQNGTTVRFTTNLGRVDPVETQTKNGIATTTFFAGDVSGAAEVTATSGGGGNGSTGTAAATNAVTILVGAAAVDSVTVRSSAGFVPATGGSVDIIASVLSTGGSVGGTSVAGSPMPGVTVTFNSNAGTLSGTREVTDGNGEAKVRLTTDANTTVTATAGTKSGSVTVNALTPVATPTVTLAASTSAAATSAGQLWTLTVTVANNSAVGSPTKFDWDFGDGTTVTNNSPSTQHVYTKELTVFHPSVKVTFANGSTGTGTTDLVTADFP